MSEEVVDQCLSNGLILAKILENLSLTDLKNCTLVNWNWNKEAVKFIRSKSCLQITDHDRISTHLELVKNGAPIHPNIGLSCSTPHYYWNFSTEDEEQVKVRTARFLEWMQLVGNNVKKAALGLDKSGRSLNGEQYQQIFLKMSNVEELEITLQMDIPDDVIDLRSCIPEHCALNSLKSFGFVIHEKENDNELDDDEDEDYGGTDWTKLSEEMRPFLVGLLSTATNLAKLSDNNGIAVSLALSEINKLTDPHGGRFGKIEEIETPPRNLSKRILLNRFQQFVSLRKVTFTVDRSNTWFIQPILNKYKDALTHLTLQYEDTSYITDEHPVPWDATLVLPNMTKLEKLVLQFGLLAMFHNCDATSDDTSMFPRFRFNQGDAELGEISFYPELKEMKVKMEDVDLIVELMEGLFTAEGLDVGYKDFFPKVERLVIFQDWDKFGDDNERLFDRICDYLPNCEDFATEEV